RVLCRHISIRAIRHRCASARQYFREVRTRHTRRCISPRTKRRRRGIRNALAERRHQLAGFVTFRQYRKAAGAAPIQASAGGTGNIVFVGIASEAPMVQAVGSLWAMLPRRNAQVTRYPSEKSRAATFSRSTLKGRYTVKCQKRADLPDMVFAMKSAEYRLTAVDYARPLFSSSDCVLMFEESASWWALGTSFVFPYCLLVDYRSSALLGVNLSRMWRGDNLLGAGAFGTVYLGRVRRTRSGLSDALVAVKMLQGSADNTSKAEFLREIELMKSLDHHERLVNLLGCLTLTEPLCLVMEYCSDGDLLRFLRARCDYMLQLVEGGIAYWESQCDEPVNYSMIMTIRQLLYFAVQVCVGMQYLSGKGFIHRDLAARNVFVLDGTNVKIGDFGLCRHVSTTGEDYFGRGGRLPIKWMAPESIRECVFSVKSDVWAFGVLLFEIITLGGTPYPGIAVEDLLVILDAGDRIPQPDNCSNEM
ncbi:Protein kinase domain containing protein, partial [Aphelenchoides avenae]